MAQSFSFDAPSVPNTCEHAEVVRAVADEALPSCMGSAMDLLDDAVIVLDRNWRILHANRRAVRHDYSPDAVVGMSFWSAPLCLPASERRSFYEHAVKMPEPFRFDWHDDVQDRWLEIKAAPLPDGNLVVQAHDATDERRTHKALRDSEQFHRLIAELTSDYAYSCTVYPDNTISMTTVTEGFTRVTGYTLEEIQEIGDWPRLIHPEDLPRAIEEGQELLQRRMMHELRIITKSGDVRRIRYSTHPYRDPECGRVTRLIGAVKDVTEAREAEDQLRDYAERLKSLSRRLLQVQEDERRHLARELHDEVGQLLTGLRLSLEATRRAPAGDIDPGLNQGLGLVRELTHKVRDISLALRPSMLDDLGLLPALLWHFERYTSQTGVVVNFDHSGLNSRLGTAVETAAYRIIQEALTNVARHAGVKSATVHIHGGEGQLSLVVEDQGKGCTLQSVGQNSGGLSGMQERAELLGGHFRVESTPGNGLRLCAELPLT